MLKNTFHHLPGIGAHTERQIWSAGIFAWDDFKSDITRYGLIVTYNGKCFDIPFIERIPLLPAAIGLIYRRSP
jgi:uncharacterized protein YprB with RNaseH-like and TPR domain